ncbi:conserved hypothetical protein [Neisseria gonorrhoeae]|nr:conserved hypothetical protein [Neisseria gonorrhoeae]SCW16549.1 conserved hypothetical protein [Neisseria gonorrhoeae]SCW18241.1 conserved hypothetical protein [Neisseria gonorrhoeae]
MERCTKQRDSSRNQTDEQVNLLGGQEIKYHKADKDRTQCTAGNVGEINIGNLSSGFVAIRTHMVYKWENQPPDDGRQGNEDTGVVDEAGKTRQQPRSTQNQKIGNTRPQEALPDKGNINKAAAANPFAKIRADGDTGQKTGKSK